jgi:coniferyl-aldehyde dehydrogenase
MHSLPPSAPPTPHAIAPSASGNTGPAATTPAELMSALARLREAWQARKPDPSQRLDDLRRLHAALKGRLDEMTDAAATSATVRVTNRCWPKA